MKLYNKLGWAVLPFALLAASCQNDDFMEAGHEAAEGVMTLHATMAPQTRAQIALGTEDESREIFMWNEGDSFTLYDKTNPTTTSAAFTISGYSEEAPATEATFVGEGNFANNSSVIAIYPAQEGNVTESAATLTLPTATITTGSAEEWKEYMRQSMYMYADATIDGNNTALAFKHLCALIRVSYTNATSEDKTITNVTVTGEGNYFGSIAKFEFANNALTSTKTSSTCEFNFSGLTVASGRTTDFYFFFFPGDDASNGTLTVSINDKELEMSLSDLTSFSGFEAGKRYWFNTIETPDEGIIWKKDVPEVLITNLPLIEVIESQNGITFEKDEDGYVNVTLNQNKISQVKAVELIDQSDKIENLDGLEYFTNLETLVLQNMGLTTLDVSRLTNLKVLACPNNPELKTLDLSANTELQDLTCPYTGLSTLDLSQNTELINLSCPATPIENLDLSTNLKLEMLDLGAIESITSNVGSVSSINVLIQNKTELRSLWIEGCTNITEIDLSNNLKLESFGCTGTSITALDLTHNTALTELRCAQLGITKLDLNQNKALKYLDCAMTLITELDISNNPELIDLQCVDTEITKLDLSNNTKLTELRVGNTQIKELDLSNNLLLTALSCVSTPISALDVSKQVALTSLSCGNTNIAKLNISKNSELQYLRCFNCNLTELDITNNPNLEELVCGHQRTSDGSPITLYLTADQKQNLWDGNMEWESSNEDVNLVTK